MRNKEEAHEIASGETERLRGLPRDQLLEYMDNPRTWEVTGESGRTFQLEALAFWEDRKQENFRVVVFD
jgi:hypothetical protein